jgi:hypothetical protein
VRPCASYELVVMMAGAGWEIAGVRTQAAKRLLKAAGLFSADLPLFASSHAVAHSPALRGFDRVGACCPVSPRRVPTTCIANSGSLGTRQSL